MKHRIKNTLRALSKHLGLKVKFVHYLGDETHGVLLPREKRILINAHKPREEHFFTVLHEIGHYVMHFQRPPSKFHPRVFEIRWTIDWLECFCSMVRRYYRFNFNKASGKEWQADLWAMLAFIHITRCIGCYAELVAFVRRHPEKTKVFLLAASGSVYCDTKTRFKKVFQALAMPIRQLSRLKLS